VVPFGDMDFIVITAPAEVADIALIFVVKLVAIDVKVAELVNKSETHLVRN